MKEMIVDPHALSECPTCGHDLLRDTDFKTYFCSNCGWVLPSAWELFHLLRQARNWVQDKDNVLRNKITKIAPPERRPKEPESKTCDCMGGCRFILPMGYTMEQFKQWGGGSLPDGVKCMHGFTQIMNPDDDPTAKRI